MRAFVNLLKNLTYNKFQKSKVNRQSVRPSDCNLNKKNLNHNKIKTLPSEEIVHTFKDQKGNKHYYNGGQGWL